MERLSNLMFDLSVCAKRDVTAKRPEIQKRKVLKERFLVGGAQGFIYDNRVNKLEFKYFFKMKIPQQYLIKVIT